MKSILQYSLFFILYSLEVRLTWLPTVKSPMIQTALGSSRRLGRAAGNLIDGSEKCICRLSFGFQSPHVIKRRSNAKGSHLWLPCFNYKPYTTKVFDFCKLEIRESHAITCNRGSERKPGRANFQQSASKAFGVLFSMFSKLSFFILRWCWCVSGDWEWRGGLSQFLFPCLEPFP